MRYRYPFVFRAVVLTLVLSLASPAVVAQRIRQDANGRLIPELSGVRVSPEEQIKIGREAAAEVYKQMPVLPDGSPVTRFVQRMGARLVEKAPGYRWPFEFHVIAQKEINAFALPGGPIFINLGSIQAADENELAGVMAHEISHVVMQHSARDAGKQKTTQTIGALGAIAAGVLLGNGMAGNLASGAVQLGAGMVSMRYSREDENEADLLGAQTMYDAGYNPYSLAEFFQKLAAQDGNGVQFLSDHPNPGNRAENIQRVIQRFPPKSYPRSDSPEFVAMKRVAEHMHTYTAQQISHHRGPWNLDDAGAGAAAVPSGGSIETVSYEQVRPSGTWSQFRQGGIAFDYPSNWQLSNSQGGILVAPPAGVGPNGAIAYGVSIRATRSGQQTGDMREVARALADDIVQSNPGMKILGGPNRLQVNGAPAIAYDLVGDSPVRTGDTPMRERDWLVTIPREDGSSIALIFTAPDRDYAQMKRTFQTMLRSFRVQ